ncbi:MAG: helix-turn-helix domain-containing protein [Maritimibacter sp.]|nr:helix-turn-helix domain-containing protein [Maritimibacter sp.]
MTISPERGPALLTPQEVADRLKISLRHVYNLVGAGDLPPPLKVGRLSRWREADLASYLERLAQISRDAEKVA